MFITSTRAPLPVPEIAAAPTQGVRSGHGASQVRGSAPPVAEPALHQAITLGAPASGTGSSALMLARAAVDDQAAAAATAAREVYIRASIAAGISPLPLTGL